MNINKLKSYINKNSKFVFKILVILGIIFMAIVINVRQNSSNEIDLSKTSGDTTQSTESTTKTSEYYVDISGAVKDPGVYKVKKKTRLVELIDKAGGLTEKADLDAINQAAFVEDGAKIIIPEKGSASTSAPTSDNGGSSSGITSTGKVNINQASQDELKTLPGVGDAIAQRIIEYRNGNRFGSIEDIKNVKGIGDATFENLKDLITV